ncbi:MAG: TonB-dependent receptor, partial [Bacteroidota bacterium]
MRVRIVTILFCCLLGYYAAAQGSFAVVSSDSGEPLVGATVVIESSSGSEIEQLISDGNGRVTTNLAFPFKAEIRFVGFETVNLIIRKEGQKVRLITDSRSLEEVIVSATRTERQLSSVPLNAQIISEEEISSINSVRLSDVLNEQTGLITVPDFGGGEGVQLQGFDSQYTLIMIDGVPLIGRSAGTLDLSRVSVGNIKQIEVVKGASSSLYGNEALGGIINIITDTPKNGFTGDVNYRGGTNNSHDLSSTISYKNEKLTISTFFNRFSSQGYDLVDTTVTKTVEPFENYTINPKVVYSFSERTNLSLSGRFYHQRQDNVASAALTGKSFLNEWNGHLKLNHIFNSKWDSYFEFYATQYKAEEYLNDDEGNRFSESDFNQHFIRPEIRTTYSLSEGQLFIGGIGLTNERLERSAFFGTPVFNSPYIYLQYDGSFFDKLNVIIGARFDSHNEYASQLSPKAALRYEINDKLSVKTSIGYGFKAPDFRQLYFDFTNSTVGYTVLGYNAVTTRIPEMEAAGELVSIGVPLSEFENELKAESSVSFNFGVDYSPFDQLQLNANIFRSNVQNLIDTRVIARKTIGQNVFSYYNVNEVYKEGLEFNAKWNASPTLSIAGGYQLLYAKDREAEEFFESSNGVIVRDPVTLESTRVQTDYFGLFNRS